MDYATTKLQLCTWKSFIIKKKGEICGFPEEQSSFISQKAAGTVFTPAQTFFLKEGLLEPGRSMSDMS